MMGEPRFLLDGMLGSLARWLRICGYEAKYIGDALDDDLLKLAGGGGLVLLTRDRLLFRKAQRAGIKGFLVEGEDDSGKLASVSRRYGLRLSPQNSRCPECGEHLRKASKESLVSSIHTGTFEAYDDFWVCDSCGKVYWRGSHWENIVRTIEEASRVAGGVQGSSEHDL